jgi:phospholipid/cholesterol/gamma-HCH transport system substrate-binding protein
MGKRANPATIGAFVVGAIALASLAIVVLGTGRLFHKQHPYVLFFNGDVNGLRVGAPVKFKGVQIGTVTKILINLHFMSGHARPANTSVRIPVIISLDEKRLEAHGAGTVDLDDPEFMNDAIAHGLRAQLSTESLLTGLLYVDLDIHPNVPVRYEKPRDFRFRYQEIPTMPTTLEQVQSAATRILAALDKVDLAKLVTSGAQAMDSVRQLVTSPQLKAAINHLDITEQKLSDTTVSIKGMADKVRKEIGPMSASVHTTANNADATLKQARATLGQIDMTIQPQAPLVYRADRALRDVSAAANAVRQLAEFLQRNPSALVRGRGYGKDER